MENVKHMRKIVLIAFLSFIGAVGIFVGGYVIGDKTAMDRFIAGQDINVVTQLKNTKTEYRELDMATLWDVWDQLNTSYLEKNIDNEALYQSAIKGLVAGLNDPYTNYFTADELAVITKADSGELEGIGVTLRNEDQYTVVESVVDGFPASKNGIKSGDVILEVDNIDMVSMPAAEVATYIRGKAGTKVNLGLFRPSTQKEFSLTITREVINIDNITIGETRDGIVVIKIYKFTESSLEEFKSMWDEVVTEVKAMNPKGVIIDLRGNPGGYVSGVEYILADLLPKGQVTFMEEDRNGNQTRHVVERTGKLTDVKLALIVNAGSASASEIMAGALQDHQRATIIGEKTVGKGVEQQLINLNDGSQLRIVFRKWLTPKGHNINSESPITPDVLLEDYNEQTNKAFDVLK